MFVKKETSKNSKRPKTSSAGTQQASINKKKANLVGSEDFINPLDSHFIPLL